MADIQKAKAHLENISKICLDKSAASLGMMIRKKVSVEDFEIIGSCEGLSNLDEPHDLLVTTEIIGDVNGKSYLMLTSDVGDKIYEVVFGPKKEGITTEVVLKEVDNIVSAAVISVLADSFQVEIFGDVPYFFVFNPEKTLELINDDCINYSQEEDKFLIKSTLVCEEINIRMGFYWIISGEILEKAELAT